MSILKVDSLSTRTGSGVITSANAIVSPGQIVQVVTSTSTASGAVSSSDPGTTIGLQLFNQPFTPKLANSIILVQTSTVEIHEEANTANICWLGAWYDSTQIGVNSATINYTSWTSSLNAGYYSLNHSTPSWGLTTKNINVRAGINTGTAWINANSYSMYSAGQRQIGLTIMEIAQ